MALSKMTSRRSGAQGQRGVEMVPGTWDVTTFRSCSVSSRNMLQCFAMSLGSSSLLWLCRRPVPDSFSAIEMIISQTQSIVRNAQKWPRTKDSVTMATATAIISIPNCRTESSMTYDPKRCMCPRNFFAAMMSQLSLASFTIDLGPSCTMRMRSWESMLMTQTSYLTCLAAQDQRRRKEFRCGHFVLRAQLALRNARSKVDRWKPKFGETDSTD